MEEENKGKTHKKVKKDKVKTKNGKGGKKLLIAILVILILAAIAGGVFYFLKVKSNPKDILTSKINEVIDGVANTENYKTVERNIVLTADFEAEPNSEYEAISEWLNKLKLAVNAQTDVNKKLENIDVNFTYEDRSLIKGNAYYNDAEGNIYIFVDTLNDKYLKVPLNKISNNGELKTTLNALWGNMTDSTNSAKARSILKSKIAEKLKDEYFTSTNDKTTFKITFEQLNTVITEICNELSENGEFLSCYENQEEIKSSLMNISNTVSQSLSSFVETTIELTLYKSGFLGMNINKAELSISDSSETLKFALEKVDNKYILTMRIPDAGKFTFYLEYTENTNVEVSTPNTSNSIDTSNLSNELIKTLNENVKKIPLYRLISSLSGDFNIF